MDELYGWAFPIDIEPLSGRIKKVSNEQSVRQSLEIILSTSPGERYLHPDFGCNLRSYVFEPVNYTTLKRIEDDVRISVARWEKRAVLLSVVASSEDNAHITIELEYKLIDDSAIFNYRYNLDVR